MIARINTPAITCRIMPIPPLNDTPPNTQAEITVSSKPWPIMGWPEVMRDARITPANAPITPCTAKMMILVRSTFTPASSAASWLPPMAMVLRP
ncbi:hypothetical protein D3C78_1570460 [compost metagenome]